MAEFMKYDFTNLVKKRSDVKIINSINKIKRNEMYSFISILDKFKCGIFYRWDYSYLWTDIEATDFSQITGIEVKLKRLTNNTSITVYQHVIVVEG